MVGCGWWRGRSEEELAVLRSLTYEEAVCLLAAKMKAADVYRADLTVEPNAHDRFTKQNEVEPGDLVHSVKLARERWSTISVAGMTMEFTKFMELGAWRYR